MPTYQIAPWLGSGEGLHHTYGGKGYVPPAGEWVPERDRMRFGFGAEGVRLEAGDNPAGCEEGSLGWFVDQPSFLFPDGSAMSTRLTAVVRQEDDRWKLVHMHVSVGVPDEEVVELQKRWPS